MRLDQDTIAFTETTKIFVQAKDSSNQDIEFEGTNLLTCSIDSTVYGSFINAAGDTISPPLADVLYRDAKTGNIRFAAVNKNPDSVVSFKIFVKLQEDTTKTGDTTLVLWEQTLKIVMNEPREVRPSIPTEDQDTSKTRLRKKPFEVRMTRAGKPVPNHPFRLRTDYVRESGGHTHGDTRDVSRTNNDDSYGYFTAGQGTQHRRPLDDVTDVSGKFTVTYNAPIFGDSMKIYLQSSDPNKKKFLKDSVTIVEKVAGLVNFRNVPANSQWLLVQSPTGTLRHPDNNWCTQTFADSLKYAIEEFYDWTSTEAGGGSSLAVSVNDMSLIFGGRFDINGIWRHVKDKQHKFHRVGTSVDINNNMSLDQLTQLEEFMQNNGLKRNDERPEIHFGSDGGN